MWGERQTASDDCSAVDRPAPDQKIGRAPQIARPPLTMAKREIVDLRKDKQVVAIVVIRAVSNSAVDVVIASVVVRGMLEGVTALEGQTTGEALFNCRLQGIVVVIGIASEIIDILRPAVVVVERPAVVLWYSSCKANHCGVIRSEERPCREMGEVAVGGAARA